MLDFTTQVENAIDYMQEDALALQDHLIIANQNLMILVDLIRTELTKV